MLIEDRRRDRRRRVVVEVKMLHLISSLTMTNSNPIITLMTDFGLRDHYVAAMKGVILGICPQAGIVDVTHEVSSYEIAGGCFSIVADLGMFSEKDGAHGGGRSGRGQHAAAHPGGSRRATIRCAGQRGADPVLTREGCKVRHITARSISAGRSARPFTAGIFLLRSPRIWPAARRPPSSGRSSRIICG